MTFPEWAPSPLIEQFNELKESAEKYRLQGDEDSDFFPLINQCHGKDCADYDDCNHRENPEKRRKEKEDLADILDRLLSSSDMKPAWEAISTRGPVNTRYIKIHESLLWNCITRALADFRFQASRNQTKAQRAKKLQSIQAKAKTLLQEVADDSEIRGIADDLMGNHLAIKGFDYRGKMPSPVEQIIPTIYLDEDIHLARHEVSELDKSGDSPQWETLPLIARLEFWATSAKETTLTELLLQFVDALQNAETQAPEIKQPGRKDQAIKAFLIRRLSAFMNHIYGQPLDDAVARTVSTVLDLQTPLTRDDVRPYLADGGKKLTTNR